ncbi:MAG: hypothetical protein J5925_04130, partial [Clostridia bacterium]|nr:hypothetical protein [Clostridia bacterium]
MTVTELHNVHFATFIEAVEQCKGNVWLITEDGDKLNLKSRFCQILGLAKIVEGGIVTEAKIYCDNVEDLSLLFRFNLYGDKVLKEHAEAA